MIVKMKKLDLLLLAKDRDIILEDLRGLGVVHIEEKPDSSSAELEKSVQELKGVEQTLQAILKTMKDRKIRKKSAGKAGKPEEIVADWQDLEKRILSLESRLAGLRKEAETLAAWGDFDPSLIDKLAGEGVSVRFFEVQAKEGRALAEKHPGLIPVSTGGGKTRFVLFEKGEQAVMDAEEVRLPRAALSALKAGIAEGDLALADLEKEKEKFFGSTDLLSAAKNDLASSVRFENARLSCAEEAEGKVLYLTGWFPAKASVPVREKLETRKTWFEISAPGPQDAPPVELANDPFTRLFEPILKLYALPGAREIDPTVFFAPFFMMFVGLCLGDAGYGLILFTVSLLLALTIPKKFKPFAMLGVLLGFSTMVAGLLLNSFFCLPLFAGDGLSGVLPFGARAALFRPFTGESGTVYPMMSFSILVGVCQLLLAFIVRTANKIRTSGLLAGIVPLSLMMFLVSLLSILAHKNAFDLNAASFHVPGIPVAFGQWLLVIPYPVSVVMFFGALGLNIAFSNRDKKGGSRVTMIIVDLYNGLTGLLSTILSYMRLFALGLTSGLLGGVFNDLAMGFITKDGVVNALSPMIIPTVLLLLGGHGLNFALAMVGSAVHPLRLTFVEFLQNIDYEWSGRPYKPLQKA